MCRQFFNPKTLWRTGRKNAGQHARGRPNGGLASRRASAGRAGSGRSPSPLAAGNEETALIHLWEVPTGQTIRRITGPQGSVSCLAFSFDGRMLASGGGDTTILLWDLTGAADATTIKPGPLTAADRAGFWSNLAGDAAKAYGVIWSLVRTPQQSVTWLKDRLQP
jgi:WD domain, G-beta repeat